MWLEKSAFLSRRAATVEVAIVQVAMLRLFDS
jgi:hypothetical protein